MPRPLIRLFAVAVSMATLIWILLDDQTRGPVVTQLERQESFAVSFEARRGAPDVEESGVLDRTLEVVFEGEDGDELLRGRLEFTRQGFRRTWSGSTAAELRLPPSAGCLVSTRVPGAARRVRLAAEGLAERTLELDGGAPNGGLPARVPLLPAE